jgi:hypothetical protein
MRARSSSALIFERAAFRPLYFPAALARAIYARPKSGVDGPGLMYALHGGYLERSFRTHSNAFSSSPQKMGPSVGSTSTPLTKTERRRSIGTPRNAIHLLPLTRCKSRYRAMIGSSVRSGSWPSSRYQIGMGSELSRQ